MVDRFGVRERRAGASSSAPATPCGSRSTRWSRAPAARGRRLRRHAARDATIFARRARRSTVRAPATRWRSSPRGCRCRRASAASCATATRSTRIVEERDATPDAARDRRDERRASTRSTKRALRDAVAELRNDNAQGEYYLTDTVGYLVARGKRVRPVAVADSSHGARASTTASNSRAARASDERAHLRAATCAPA